MTSTEMKIDTEQLLSQSEVAALKKMSLSLLAHHLAKPDAPKPVMVFGRKAYRLAEITAWHPKRINRSD